MTAQKSKYQVLLFSNNDLVIKDVRSELQKTKLFRLQEGKVSDVNKFPQIISENKPEVVFLDYDLQTEDTVQWVEQLIRQFPTIPVMVIFSEEDIQYSSNVVLAGARAFLPYPFEHDLFTKTMDRIHDLIERLRQTQAPILPPAPTKKNCTFAVFSPKGGVGTTSIAINLAIAFRQMQNGDKRRVLLVDGKHHFGHVSLLLNLRTANSVVDLISHTGKLDSGLIRQVTIPHSSGIDVLASPASFAEAQGIRPDVLYKSIVSIQDVYDTVFIDAGNFLDENAVTYMDSAFRILLILTPDLASLRDAKKFIDITRTLSYPRDKIAIILNKTGKKSEMRLSEIEKVLKTKILGTIQSSEELMLNCTNEGIPVILKKTRHSISKSFRAIVKELRHMVDNKSSRSQSSKDDLLKISSQLG